MTDTSRPKILLAHCDHRGCDFMPLDLQLPIQSVPITTKVVSLNPAYGEVYSIQHDVIKFVSDFLQVVDLLQVP